MHALEGVKILDLSRKLTASLATMYLSRFGAEVTKLERTGTGDPARKWFPKRKDDSLYFAYLNGGKKSLALDITTPEGREAFLRILPMYDVLCEDFGAGYMESLGLGHEDLKAVKPDLIFASYSFFGHTGPYKNFPASSLVAQAKSVAMDMTGVEGGYPVKNDPSAGEHFSAAYLTTGIAMALIGKTLTGKGQKVDIAMADSLFSSVEAAPAACSSVGEIHTRKGNFDPSCAPYDTFETNDGFVAVGCATETHWQKFCDALGYQDLRDEPRFLDNESRRTDYLYVLRPLLAKRLLPVSKYDIEQKCRSVGIPCCAMLSIGEVTDHPNTEDNRLLTKTAGSRTASFKVPSLAVGLSATPAAVPADAPLLGEHTQETLRAAGFSSEEIARFEAGRGGQQI